MGVLQLIGLLIRTGIPQIAEATSIAFMDDPDIPAYSIRVMNNGSEAEIAGGIKFGLSSDFEKVLNASRGVRVVFLFARGEIGENLLRMQGGSAVKSIGDRCRVHVIDGADHIFSQGPARHKLLQLLTSELPR